MLYLTLKWLHIVAVISWMGGILYLFRLFVYHQEQGQDVKTIHTLLSTMEAKLYRLIVMPAMGVTWLAGLAMLMLQPVFLKGGWMHSKFLLVLLLTVVTVYAGRLKRALERKDFNRVPSGRALRIWNEVPTLLMVIIVGLVVFKP
jgi:putative membrane protein